MTIEAYAKVNLTLEVFGVRGDGYHALRSVVAPISLSDTIAIEAADGISSDSPYADDLCLKAARVLYGSMTADGRQPTSGAAIHVVKRIPAGGGLGGGSADAAAVLRALNEMWNAGLSPEELADVGAQVGSDVPALVMAQHYRSPVVMEGRGEKVRRLGTAAAGLSLVLVNPGVHTSTPSVFALAGERDANAPSATAECEAALCSGDLKRIASSFVNDLTLPACRLHPEIADAISSLRSAGAVCAAMSGSGSTVFALAESDERAKELADMMTAKKFSAWAVRTLAADMV